MKKYLFLFIFIFLTSCQYIQYHPYEMVDESPRQLTQKHITQIESNCNGHDTIRIAFISDTQRQYDLTRDAVNYINKITNLDFVLHGGDITDFGLTDEFDWMTSILCNLSVPFVTVIGNHDFLGTAEHNYERIYGPYNWSFNAGHVHFVGLNTNSRELQYATPVPDFTFLQKDINSVDSLNQIAPDSITHTVILMHARPDDEQFNNNVVIPFAYYIQQYPGLQESSPKWSASELLEKNLSDDDRTAMIDSYKYSIVLHGHNHQHRLAHYLEQDLLFYGIPDIKDREIYLFTFTSSGFDYECVSF